MSNSKKQKKKEIIMKQSKKIILAIAFLGMAITDVAFAKSFWKQITSTPKKRRVTFSNDYGMKVLIHGTWKMIESPHTIMYTDNIVKSGNHNIRIAGPAVGYRLLKISVTPAVNLTAAIAGFGIGYGVTHSLNNDKQKAHKDKFFHITAMDKKSKIETQHQIKVTGYKNKKAYKAAEVEKTAEESVKLATKSEKLNAKAKRLNEKLEISETELNQLSDDQNTLLTDKDLLLLESASNDLEDDINTEDEDLEDDDSDDEDDNLDDEDDSEDDDDEDDYDDEDIDQVI